MNQLNGYEQMFSEMISSGQFCPPECRIDPAKPLPKEYFHPFEEEKTDVLAAIQMTHKALQTWIPIGKETNRFGFEYIRISRIIEKAVTTLARGLMTLHVNNIDLTSAPISIDELLEIASFHFRKSYRGAMAASASLNQDAFMRLFSNQLKWLTMLQRLDRTKEKLSQSVSPTRNLQTKNKDNSGQFHAFPALEEPSGLSSNQAFRPYESLSQHQEFSQIRHGNLSEPINLQDHAGNSGTHSLQNPVTSPISSNQENPKIVTREEPKPESEQTSYTNFTEEKPTENSKSEERSDPGSERSDSSEYIPGSEPETVCELSQDQAEDQDVSEVSESFPHDVSGGPFLPFFSEKLFDLAALSQFAETFDSS